MISVSNFQLWELFSPLQYECQHVKRKRYMSNIFSTILYISFIRIDDLYVILYRLGLIFKLIHTDWLSHLLLCFLYKTPNHAGCVLAINVWSTPKTKERR